MALPARNIEAEVSVEDRIARLETHTEHILAYVQQLRRGMEKLDEKIDKKTDELNQKIDSKFGELQKVLESMKLGRVWDRVWMLLAMGTLLGVMARGFKWI